MRRRRTCSDCNKPLGATLAKCFDCGGEQPDNHDDSHESRVTWQSLLGVNPELIDTSHRDT
jgi:hypothetical protein